MGDWIIYFGLSEFILLLAVVLLVAGVAGWAVARRRDLRMLLRRLGELLEALVHGALIVRDGGRVVLANSEARELWGKDLLSGGIEPELATLAAEVQRAATSSVRILERPPDRKLQVRATPIRSKLTLITLEDLSGRRYRESFFRNFVDGVSHELKTPLTVIQGHIAAMGEGLAEDDPRQTSRRIVAAEAIRLTQLVDNLLLLSRLEMPDFVLERRPVNLEGVVEDAIIEMSELAEARSVSLELQREGRLPRISADRARLKQVFINLLDNGIKYNRENGSVTVRLSADEEHVIVRVADTGEGIPPQDLPHVFEKMYRVERRGSRPVEGTGLGLSIVRRIVEQHGADMSVSSVVGEGTTFTLALPRPADAAEGTVT